jgi:hypothetical protein
MEEKGALLIGPSNGWMFAQKIYDLPVHQEFLREAGANAVELVLNLNEVERQRTLLSGKVDAGFVSLHLGYYPEKPTEEQVQMAKNILDKHQAVAGVIHPDNTPGSYLESLVAAGIPSAIENMDKNKSCGYAIKELRGLIEKHGLKFVLDLQHAFEHDLDMNYAWDLFEMAGSNLFYLHVSGQTSENIHSLVHMAENATAIVEFLGKVLSEKKLPIILEGQYATVSEVKKEIEFLKQELDF